MIAKMQEVNVGVIGLGNVGSGTLAILAENADQIALKLGFRLRVTAVCSRSVESQRSCRNHSARCSAPPTGAKWWRIPTSISSPNWSAGPRWRAEIIDAAIANKKSVVTANKELMALCGSEIWDRAIRAGINLAMEASVAGGIPIHAVLREGISGDRVIALYGILNGTSNFILTEMEKRGDSARDRAGRGAAPGLRRSRSQRRCRRLRRALQARHPGGAGVRREDHALRYLSSKASAASRPWIFSTRTSWTTPSG